MMISRKDRRTFSTWRLFLWPPKVLLYTTIITTLLLGAAPAPCWAIRDVPVSDGQTAKIPRAGILTFRGGPYKKRPSSILASSTSSSKRRLEGSSSDGDERRRRSSNSEYRPWTVDVVKRPGQMSLTSKIVITNLVCFALQAFYPSITQKGAKVSDVILSGRQLHRLITPVFLHGGIGHLLANTYSLQNIGPEVESLFGKGRFLATYLISGVAGNALSAVKSPNPSVGASGAIFGLVGAYFVFLNRNRQIFGRSAELGIGAIMQTVTMNVFLGLTNPMIDNWGHIGGAVGGAAMAYYFGPKLYVAFTPTGNTLLVDKPVLRLPPVIESFPEKIGRKFTGAKRTMQGKQYKSDLTAEPWRQNVPKIPTRSIKPRYE